MTFPIMESLYEPDTFSAQKRHRSTVPKVQKLYSDLKF